MKEICSPGSYGLNPGKILLDRLIHCWSFSCLPCMTETDKQCMTETDKQYKLDHTKVCGGKVLQKRMTLRFILIFTQAGYVHRLCLAILTAHWANYDYIGGREGCPAIPLKHSLSPTKVDMSLAIEM